MKRFILLTVATVFFAFHIAIASAAAIELPPDVRTVKMNEKGEAVTLSLEQITEGKRLFNFACAQCHAGGDTKTDPNISLGPKALALATPQRDNVQALVDYMHHPTTFDGEIEIAELHPSTESADMFPEMRNLSDDNLMEIAGHILFQPKIVGEKWGGGKSVR